MSFGHSVTEAFSLLWIYIAPEITYDYIRLQRQYEGIEFAYDGMKIELP